MILSDPANLSSDAKSFDAASGADWLVKTCTERKTTTNKPADIKILITDFLDMLTSFLDGFKKLFR